MYLKLIFDSSNIQSGGGWGVCVCGGGGGGWGGRGGTGQSKMGWRRRARVLFYRYHIYPKLLTECLSKQRRASSDAEEYDI